MKDRIETVNARKDERDEIERLMKLYVKDGGKVTKLPAFKASNPKLTPFGTGGLRTGNAIPTWSE